ncbi:hypothetical protein A2686_01630 [Candidatus Woesebacteria bacterium RIFCSPHIGHO2_01_FULL_38_10]|uniref:Proline--tRNA ligase n=1 Tax=Candidatus Woesebacteria bacterium RIFCSPLOWO2_01_FULL_39_10b TaxID=1802517 RepID=A0A1F8B842_9BACT|nr:MAG: hypothetical protein A2686_01630 [Candidatus Woesebacteria bacterium RIFCSPHIGHO2_01_FULL_38_10]OGM59595.1 MAG: hypothetical protein A2892_04595 [Candidatus Woesebacteria bacterium RIFCSPLOWO2_01_FULL_39_10b]
MLQSEIFPKTGKEPPREAESANHKLLVRAGFIDQLMTGSWTLLPLGWRVVEKINAIIREEINKTGAQEVLMPLLHPKAIWNETGRWEKAKEIMYQFKDHRGKEYALSFTHEEIFLDIVRKHITSYQDLPIALYHFSTKFRNEPRARSGILRGREFMMKDLYSVHATEEEFWKYYEKVRQAYLRIFKRMGFDVKITEAEGGVFTDNNTHEFQVLAEGGEDTIYYCKKCNWGANKELVTNKKLLTIKCPACKSPAIKKSKAIEVGNIFPFGTWYSERMHVYYQDKFGKKKPVWFGSYGIGSTRLMGAWVEVSHDQKGIVWNKEISPFDVHLIELKTKKEGYKAKKVYEKLNENGINVLWDNRDISAGEKFTDCDLIGIPIRLVVSEKTGNKLEWKKRESDKVYFFTLHKVIEKLLG